MVTHTQNLCSAFNPSKVHTHTVNTHPEQWAAIYAAAPREQLVVRCLAQGHLSHGIEGRDGRIDPKVSIISILMLYRKDRSSHKNIDSKVHFFNHYFYLLKNLVHKISF